MTRGWSGPEASQGRRLSISCTDPHAHRRAWRSIFGQHLHCAECVKPCRPEVVADYVDLDAELATGEKRSVGKLKNVASRATKSKKKAEASAAAEK